MIKLVIFDLDGVLIDSKEMHFKALNYALNTVNVRYVLTLEEHLAHYDGLSTMKKLEILKDRKGLPCEHFKKIYEMKQDHTERFLDDIKPNKRLIELFKKLSHRGIKVCVASNAIRKTVVSVVKNLGLYSFCFNVYSNEDVIKPKPCSEIYLRACIDAGIDPVETLIIEDSPIGRKGARASGCHLMPVMNAKSWTSADLFRELDKYEVNHMMSDKWSNNRINVVIPMAGRGLRFEKAGYTLPKPLIEIYGKPMIQIVVENLGLKNANFIFIAQKEHIEKYNLKTMLNLIAPRCKTIGIDAITEGAACTVLKAKEYIDNEDPLIIANSDQFLEWNPTDFYYAMENDRSIQGGIVCFKATHPKWSFVKIEDGFIEEVAEKKPISDDATVGVYYWKHGNQFITSAETMINRNDRINGEFYVAPAFNSAIRMGQKFKPFYVERMHGLGTPEDLSQFLRKYKGVV